VVGAWRGGLAGRRHGGRRSGAVWVVVFVTVYQVSFNRDALPDLAPFMRFELPTIGHVTDARASRWSSWRGNTAASRVSRHSPVVRDAIIAAEDKRFFSHDGVDLYAVPRVVARFGSPSGRNGSPPDRRATCRRPPGVSQGGSTITQQLVRGMFLRRQTALENSHELRNRRWLPRALSWIAGARNVNMLLRKREEIRLSLWLEQQMRVQFGSKRRAKEEILARYASFIYMGRGQYGVDRASQHYFGLPLSSLGPRDADLAAMLAGIAKSPRDYAPMSNNQAAVGRRRNQILALMEAAGFLSAPDRRRMQARPLPAVARRSAPASPASAVIEQALYELAAAHPGLGIDDLLEGDIQVETTVLAGVQRIASVALEHGLERYERRHPRSQGIVQGAIVVLRNRDGSILAEVGGRERYLGRAASYSDFNRARVSARQPGSAMKPIVYLAAFDSGQFSLDSLVPDEPISVADGNGGELKWIAFTTAVPWLIPVRMAFAESRNTVAVWLADKSASISASVGALLGVRRLYTATDRPWRVEVTARAGGVYRALASDASRCRTCQRVIRRDGRPRAAPPARPHGHPTRARARPGAPRRASQAERPMRSTGAPDRGHGNRGRRATSETRSSSVPTGSTALPWR
jgi:membrane peptidoglycan carboxypeptidase